MSEFGVQHVFLIPGFFGFSSFDDFKYFAHVEDVLQSSLSARGLQVQVHAVKTRPTAPLSVRAEYLLGEIFSAVPEAREESFDGGLHLIGHSTGGLDARWLVSPNAAWLEVPEHLDVLASRVHSVVGVASPHQGTPLAHFFIELRWGRALLRLLSLMSIHVLRRGPLPVTYALKIGALLKRLDSNSGKPANQAPSTERDRDLIDSIFDQVLSEFTPERGRALSAYFEHIANDTGLLPQLTPEGQATLRASLVDRAGIAYGSVVVRSRQPTLGAAAELGFDASAQALYALYRWLHKKAAAPGLRVEDAHEARLQSSFGEAPSTHANDGIVPTRSQVHRELIHIAWADHLDVIGHFNAPGHRPPHYDWLPTGSRFKRPHFDALWQDVAEFLARSVPGS